MKITLWTSSEINDLRNNRVPVTRTLKAARTKAFKLHIDFFPFGGEKFRKLDLTKEQRKAIANDARKSRNKTKTASKFGVNRSYVLQCCKEFNVSLIPSPHERINEHIEYDGHNWSWKKGSWICTANKVRESGEYNLGKVLWKKFHGEYPDARHDVRFIDGNRYNLNKSNLKLLTKSEAQLLRLKNPMTKAMFYASGCYGLMLNAIMEAQDPSKGKKRGKKAAATRKSRYPNLGKKVAESRKRKAEERGFYFSEEARKRMSEAHKGKPSNNKGKVWRKKRKTSSWQRNGGDTQR